MTPAEIFEAAHGKFGEAVHDLRSDPKKDKDPWFTCDVGTVAALAAWLRDEPTLAFDWLECLTGTDHPDKAVIAATIHLWSYARRHRVVFKVFLTRESPAMPTLSSVWPCANWQERECFDLLGVHFEGHPDLRRLLLPDDWVGHPLRKDYREAADYHGIPTTRPAPLDLLKIGLPKKEPVV